jgi:alkaline phosphatase D
MRPLNRRTFVLGGLAAAGAWALPWQKPARSADVGVQAVIAYPFKLGIASGDPDANSVVLWTRLAPSPLNADGQGGMPNANVTVEWQVSTDDRFSTLIASGSVTATYAQAHSVHAIAGGLNPDSDYYYRFRAQGHISPIGHTRTAPATGTFGRDLVMAFTSCAHYEGGYFTAYRRMAEDRPDLILHLGDYIYEGGAGTTGVRQHLGAEIVSLADYRRRYAQYKTDPDLQAAHAAAPWLVVPDDHEVENNYAGMVRSNNTPPLTAAEWTARRTAAYQAYYENMPLRPSSANNGNSIPLYRLVRWGNLAAFHMLDTRQYRNDQACGDGWQVCSDADLASRSLPGNAQETWLLDGLAQHYATWDILGQQVFFARQFTSSGASNMDAWDGYRASRARIQGGWVQRGTRNPVVLTGDVHRAWGNNLIADYANPNSAVVGTELVTSSVSTGGDGSGATAIPNVSTNPHLKFYSDHRGYVRTTITPTQMRADFRAVPRVTEHGVPASTLKSFVINEGRPGLQAI